MKEQGDPPVVTVSQLPKLFGLKKGPGNTVRQFGYLVAHLGQASLTTFAVGAVALVCCLHWNGTTAAAGRADRAGGPNVPACWPRSVRITSPDHADRSGLGPVGGRCVRSGVGPSGWPG